MNFTYTKEANIEVGQKLYGIIGVSNITRAGVHPVTVTKIDWNDERILFKVDQACGVVSCKFDKMNEYVFETKREAKENLKTLEHGEGMTEYNSYF